MFASKCGYCGSVHSGKCQEGEAAYKFGLALCSMNQEEMAAYYARERAKTAEAMAPVHAIAKLLGKFKREGRPVVWAEVQAVEAEARARFTRTDRPKLNSSRRIKA